MLRRYLVNRRTLIFLFVLGILVFLWQLPVIVKALPSRYAAAYLPESMQELAVRDHVEILPTAEISIDPQELIDSAEPSSKDGQSLIEISSTDLSSAGSQANPVIGSEITQAAQESPGTGSSNEPVPPISTSIPATPDPSITPTPIPPPLPLSARLGNVRHQFQTWNNCGPATLAMGLSYFDLNLRQEQTAAVLKPNPEDRNVSPDEMVNYVNNNSDLRAISRVNGDLNTILLFVDIISQKKKIVAIPIHPTVFTRGV